MQAGDTLASIALNLAQQINSDQFVQAFGLSAAASSNVLTITSPGIATPTYTSGSGPVTLTFAVQNPDQYVQFGGDVFTAGDVVTLTVFDAGLSGGQETVSYTVQASDQNAFDLAQGLAIAISSDTNLQTLGVTSYWGAQYGTALATTYLCSDSTNSTTYTVSATGSEFPALTTSSDGTVPVPQTVRNSLGNVTNLLDSIGRLLTYTYASNNIDLLEVENHNGDVVCQWAYGDSSAPHRPTSYTNGSGQTTQYSYNTPYAELASITDANGNVTSLSYDSAGYLTQIQGPLSGGQDVTSFSFFGYGKLHTVTDSEGYEVSYAYDDLNRTTSISYPDGSSEQTIYDKLDPVLSCDRLGRWSKRSYDPIDQLSCEQDPLGRATHYCWCTCGSLASITDSAGNTTMWHHDLEGRATEKIYADSSTFTYTYQPYVGFLQTRTDALGQTTRYAKNLDQSLQYKSYANAVNVTSPVSWRYDQNYPRTTAVTNGWGTYSYSYNSYPQDVIGENYRASIFIGGYPQTPNATDTITVTVFNSALSGGQYTMPVFSVPSGDAGNTTDVARDLAIAISDDPTLSAAGIICSYIGPEDILYTSGSSPITVTVSSIGSTTATLGGGGKLAEIDNDVIANSSIAYSYDALDRTVNRMINGGNNNIAWGYDAMSRTTSEANALGTFGYNYVDDVSGSSKGTTRLASISYPNGQTTNFSWYGNLGDQRLQSINNLLPSGAPLSQFSYGYDSAGEITKWGQQSADLSPRVQNLGYDAASQLTSSQSGFGASPPKYADQFYYGYDCAANRTTVQSSLTQTAAIKGTVTSGDVLTLTVNDPALSGGTESVNYTVSSGDSLSSIATKLAAAITADSNLQAIGVNAIAASNQISMKSTSANLTSYSQSTSGGATESIVLGLSTNAVQNAIIGGTVTTGDVLTLKVFDAALSGGTASVPYTVASGNSLNDIASGLATAVNGSTALSTAGITATATQNVIHLKSTSPNLTTYSQGLSSGATETIYLALNMNGPQTVLVGGSKTTGDVLGLAVFDASLSSGSEAVSYTVGSSDTLSSIASSLASAINSDTNLQGIGVSATSSGTIVTLNSLSTRGTSYQVSRPNTATETLVQGLNPNGVETAVIAGTKTTADQLTITIFDAGLSGGSKPETYTVASGDNLNSIAAGLAGVISGDSTLSALGISASSSSAVVNLSSTSNNLTTYAKSTSGGATETITLGQSAGITASSFNNLNELTSTSGGGPARFQGTTNKPIVSATIDSTVHANLPNSTSFNANPVLSSGANSSTVHVVDGNNTSVTNTYQIGVQGGPSASPVCDANGNCTSDGTNSYSYDADNRLIEIDYPGSGNNSQFTYDAGGRLVKIVESTGGSTTSTRQFVCCGLNKCEELDGIGALTKEFFSYGQIDSSTEYFYVRDALGSVELMTDNTSTIQCQSSYDPFGRRTEILQSVPSDFGYAGYFVHNRSGFSLTLARVYSPSLGRFLQRDPMAEIAGTNLFAYVGNTPSTKVDPTGFCCACQPNLIPLVSTAIGAAIGGVAGSFLGAWGGGVVGAGVGLGGGLVSAPVSGGVSVVVGTGGGAAVGAIAGGGIGGAIGVVAGAAVGNAIGNAVAASTYPGNGLPGWERPHGPQYPPFAGPYSDQNRECYCTCECAGDPDYGGCLSRCMGNSLPQPTKGDGTPIQNY